MRTRIRTTRDTRRAVLLRNATETYKQPMSLPSPPASDNLHDLFTQFDQSDLPKLSNLIKPVMQDYILCSKLVTTFELDGMFMFQSNGLDGFGPPVKLKTGESLYVRVRSFIRHSPVSGRAFEELVPGERREIQFVLTRYTRPLQDGTFHMLVAHYPIFTSAKLCPAAISHHGVFGLNGAPIVLPDAFERGNRKVSIHNRTCLFMSSCNVINGTAVKLMKGLHRNTLVQWYAGVARPTIYDNMIMMQLETRKYDDVMSASRSKITRMFEKSGEHDVPDETVHAFCRSRDPILKTSYVDHASDRDDTDPNCNATTDERVYMCEQMASLACENATLNAFLDMHASQAMQGLRVPFFRDPTTFPLYTAVCLFLAAKPSLYGVCPVSNEVCIAVSKITDECEILTTKYGSNGCGLMAIEQCLVQAIEGYTSTISLQRTSNGKSSTSRTPGNEPKKADMVPFTAHHMQRQGIAMCVELLGLQPSSYEPDFLVSEFTRECVNTAHEQIGCAVAKCSITRARESGVLGGCTHHTSSALRASTKNDMMRTLVRMIVDVNGWIESGIYDSVRVSKENSQSESALVGQNINFEASRQACHTIRMMLERGPHELTNSSCFLCYPVKRSTRPTCGECKQQFSFLDTVMRSRFSCCGECNVWFCSACYESKVQALVHGCGGVPKVEYAVANSRLWHCTYCVSRVKATNSTSRR
jgi:hypothetical protein